jgi:hypothetical protein
MLYSFFLVIPLCLNCMCHWHIKFRGQGITQKKEYNINKNGKSWKSRIIHLLWGGNCKKRSIVRKTLDQENHSFYFPPFLLHCGDHNTIACFLQFHHFIHFRTPNIIHKCTSCALLQERVHYHR